MSHAAPTSPAMRHSCAVPPVQGHFQRSFQGRGPGVRSGTRSGTRSGARPSPSSHGPLAHPGHLWSRVLPSQDLGPSPIGGNRAAIDQRASEPQAMRTGDPAWPSKPHMASLPAETAGKAQLVAARQRSPKTTPTLPAAPPTTPGLHRLLPAGSLPNRLALPEPPGLQSYNPNAPSPNLPIPNVHSHNAACPNVPDPNAPSPNTPDLSATHKQASSVRPDAAGQKWQVRRGAPDAVGKTRQTRRCWPDTVGRTLWAKSGKSDAVRQTLPNTRPALARVRGCRQRWRSFQFAKGPIR